MVFISKETPRETRRRLLRVVSTADLDWMDGVYSFREFPLHEFPISVAASALAVIRDSTTWSALTQAAEGEGELFAVFSFHFAPKLDNSGFVGWLASHLKAELGTGVFVICGQNSGRGGIFDYWGVPAQMKTGTEQVLNALRLRGSKVAPLLKLEK